MGDYDQMGSEGTPRESRLRGLIIASHFGPTVAVTAITTLLAIEARRGWGSLAVFAAVFVGQCSVGWSNDYFDAERDRRAQRVEKPLVRGLLTPLFLRNAARAALISAIILSFLSGWRAASIHSVALLSAWAYNMRMKTTWLSPLPYALSFALLPAFVTLGLPEHPWPQPAAFVAGGLLGLGAHFINTIRDVDADRLTGVTGFPQRVGPSVSLALGVTFLLGALIMTTALVPRRGVFVPIGIGVSLAADLMVLVSARQDPSSASWRWTLISALACVALFASSGSALVGH